MILERPWEAHPRRSSTVGISPRRRVDLIGAALDPLNPAESSRARDTILAGLEQQRGTAHCQMLRLAASRPIAAFLQPIVVSSIWRPNRREWLTMDSKKVFVATRSNLYHRMPLALISAGAAFSAIYMVLAGLDTSGWLRYVDFVAAAGSILGLIFIVAKPWNDEMISSDVWSDALSAILVTLASPIAGLVEISEADEFYEYAAGFTFFLFTPAWVYGLYMLLSHLFGVAIAIPIELAFIGIVVALFTIGQKRQTRSRNSLRGMFASLNVTAPTTLPN